MEGMWAGRSHGMKTSAGCVCVRVRVRACAHTYRREFRRLQRSDRPSYSLPGHKEFLFTRPESSEGRLHENGDFSSVRRMAGYKTNRQDALSSKKWNLKALGRHGISHRLNPLQCVPASPHQQSRLSNGVGFRTRQTVKWGEFRARQAGLRMGTGSGICTLVTAVCYSLSNFDRYRPLSYVFLYYSFQKLNLFVISN